MLSIKQAIKNIKSDARKNFDESVELHINLKLDVSKADEQVRTSLVLPHGSGKKIKVASFCDEDIKDVDLIFIVIQALIPTLKYASKSGYVGPDNFHTLVGKTNNLYKLSSGTISASSISEISGIPRATCIRKLEKLVQLGMLVREIKTKRYFISQVLSDRTKHITKKENIIYTIQIFSEFLSTVISALTRNKSNKL